MKRTAEQAVQQQVGIAKVVRRWTGDRLGLAAAFSVTIALASGAGRRAGASSGDGVLEPNGRGLQLLGGREAILLEQSERARRVARSRGLALYRLLRVAALDRGPSAGTAEHGGARSVALATGVLARDLEELRALRGELERVRTERASLRAWRSDDPGNDGLAKLSPEATPSFLRPVSGALVVPFGVGRDAASGAWIFRAAATFAVSAGETVRSPAEARIARVADSVAGGAAVVLSHARTGDADLASGQPAQRGDSPWTVVISGFASVAVAPGELVRRGDALGTAPTAPGSTLRIETWRGRGPVDPAGVLRAR